MEDEGIHGGVVMTFRNGRIENSFAIGNQLDKLRTPVSIDTRFPIASLTKVITASVVRSLIASGHLKLDAKASAVLPEVVFDDSRFSRITVRHLLQHTAGLPSSNLSDPMFTATSRVNGCSRAINIAGKRQLSNIPGSEINYSNVSYCLLGLIISKTSGVSYEMAAKDLVLSPASADLMSMGPIDDAEAARWASRTAEEWRSLSSAGGWFSDAHSLVKFLASDARATDIPSPPDAPYSFSYYGLGWRVWPTAKGYDLTHTGVLPESFSFAMSRHNGSAAVALFNGSVQDRDVATARLRKLLEDYL